MADLTITATGIGRSEGQLAEYTSYIAAVAITAGQAVYINSSGKADLADASVTGTAQFRGIALTGAGAGQPVTVLVRGWIEGFAVSSLAYDARVYLSDTAGALADAAGTVSVTIGRVLPIADTPTITKLLYIDTNVLAQYV